jgi:hypothetical protein
MRRRSLVPRLGRLGGDRIGLFCLNALDVLLPTMAPRSVNSGTNAPASPPQIPRSCSNCCSRASHFPSRSIPTTPYAHSIGLPSGKTEAWYVLSAAPGAKMAVGLDRRLTQPQLRQAVDDGYEFAAKKKGLLSWKWASDRLKKSRQYSIATTRADGAPHLMIIWACGSRTASGSAPGQRRAKRAIWPRTYDASLAGVCASKGTEEPHEHWSSILADHDGRSGGSPRRGTCVWFDLSAHATRN